LRQEIVNRFPNHQISESLDLLDAFFILVFPGVRYEAIARIDRAIGAYEDNRHNAWINTINPLFWLDLIADSIAESLLKALVKLGVEAVRDSSHGFGFSVFVILKILVWVMYAVAPWLLHQLSRGIL
jgi:hypothetical protein